MAQDKDEDEIHFQFGRLWQLYVPLPPGVVWWQAEWYLALRGNAPYSEKYLCALVLLDFQILLPVKFKY